MRFSVCTLAAFVTLLVYGQAVGTADEPAGRGLLELLDSHAAPAIESKVEQEILASLETQISVDFNESPLGEVAGFFADRLEQPVFLDRRALDESGITVDTPVTVSLKNIRARSALDLILESLDLEWTIWKDVLFITTSEHVSVQLSLRVYSVSDIVASTQLAQSSHATLQFIDQPTGDTAPGGNSSGQGPYASLLHVRQLGGGQVELKPGVDPVCALIEATVYPESWDRVGGSGVIQSFGNGFLVVLQTRQAHEEIEGLIKALRDKMVAPAR